MARLSSNDKKRPVKRPKSGVAARGAAVPRDVVARQTDVASPPIHDEHKTLQTRFILFFILVIGFAALLFGLVRIINPLPVKPVAMSEQEGGLPDVLRTHKDFQVWLAAWKQADPYVSRSEFRADGDHALDVDRLASSGVEPAQEDLVFPRTNRYAWSPNRRRFADFLSAYGEPDHAFRLWNRDGGGKVEMLEYCGTSCRYDGAFWLDDSRVVLLSAVEAVKADGAPYCPGADQGEAPCYQRLLVTVFDLGQGRVRTYRSEPHLFRTDPLAESTRGRWASGLTPAEKIASDAVRQDDLIAIDGTVTSSAGESVTLRSTDRTYAVTAFPQTAYRDEFGTTISAGVIRKGFVVRVTGLADGDGKLAATDVRILKSPNIVLYGPVEGDVVGARFTVVGIARTFEQNVRIRMRDAGGKLVLDTFTTADAVDVGVHGDFAATVKVPAGKIAPGQEFTLDVFESSSADGTEVNKVSITLTYQP